MDSVDKIEQFFRDDIYIKNLIYEAAYNDNYGYSTETLTQYSDYLEKVLKDVEEKLEEMVYLSNYMYELERNNDLKNLHNKIKIFEKELINCGLNKEKLENFHKNNICSMSEEFVEKVNSTVHAYGGGGISLIGDSNSINEILHVLHQKMTNNEYVYEGLPKVKYKEYGVSLYGNDIQPLAEEIFDKIDVEKLEDGADILSLNSKILMLVRGAGHALSIEINYSTINKDEVEVNYFIPKVCNVELVNLLPGVRPVKSIKDQTRGEFNIEKNKVAEYISKFIEKVPTDKSLPIPNEIYR